MRVKFLKSPVGAFKLAYVIGEEANVNPTIGEEMIDMGFAVEIEYPKETATIQQIETPEKPKKRK
jgi:hypothetical protein